ncbi:MAG: nucleotidyltransferase domain-containing protein [Candidatus Aenigmarchaeota archaeon]|nr:nucleotidyltransferase domain-containing protein [Candidatus Aenigmarchaeota archaeon]
MMLEKALSSKTRIRVLKIFHRFPGRVFSLSDIAKITGQSNGAVYPALAVLAEAGILKSSKVGKTTTYRLNVENPLSRKIMEIFSVENEMLRKAANEFAAKMPKVGVSSIIIFGSVARGEPKETSDIDLLIIYNGNRSVVEGNANTLVEKYLESDVYVSPVFYSEREIKEMVIKYNSFITKIENEGIVLYGKKLKDIYDKGAR